MNFKVALRRFIASPWVRQVYVFLSGIPIIGTIVEKFTDFAIPVNTRLWFPITIGSGKAMWAQLDPRFEMDYASGRYEWRIQQELSLNLRPGSVFYDVGAHIGIVSMFAAHLVGEKGAVFAFEADPENAKRIEEHLHRNLLNQIQVVPCAVWSSGGHRRFKRASAQSSRNQGALVPEDSAGTEDTIEVQALALDEFAQGNPPPTVIKVDVEGAEADVLCGSEEIFRSARPVLICEIHTAQASEYVMQWLRERGYTSEWLEDSVHFPRHLTAKSLT